MFIGSFLPTDERLLMVMSGSGIGMVDVKRRFAIGSSGNERFIVIAAMDKQVAQGIVMMPHQDAGWVMWHEPCSLCEGPRPTVFRGTQILVESRHLVKMSGPRIRFTSSEALWILGVRGAVTADIILEERDAEAVFYTAVVSGLTTSDDFWASSPDGLYHFTIRIHMLEADSWQGTNIVTQQDCPAGDGPGATQS